MIVAKVIEPMAKAPHMRPVIIDFFFIVAFPSKQNNYTYTRKNPHHFYEISLIKETLRTLLQSKRKELQSMKLFIFVLPNKARPKS